MMRREHRRRRDTKRQELDRVERRQARWVRHQHRLRGQLDDRDESRMWSDVEH